MPYTNIYYVKLKLELLNDKRFIFDCSPYQRWLYIGLLMLAGDTNNKIPDDENFLKNRLNLPETSQNIRVQIDAVIKLFPKLTRKNNFLKFKNFSKLHNQVRSSRGLSEDYPKGSIDKIRLDKVIEEYTKAKNWGKEIKENPSLLTEIYQRHGKAAKSLILACGGDADKACLAIRNMKDWFGGLRLEWTLETVCKHIVKALKGVCPKCKGKGKFTSSTGYEITCDCKQ